MSTQSSGSVGRCRSAVAMISDFGRDSFYVGAMKGAILAVDSEAVIVDVTHGIRPYAVEEASFVLSLVFDVWSAGTAFLVVVDPGVGGARKNLVVKSKDRLVVCPDNGIVTDVAARYGVDAVYSIDEDVAAGIRRHGASGSTFWGRDVLGPVAAFLASGGEVDRVGKRESDFCRVPVPQVEARAGYIRGHGRHVDEFGNILTDISSEDLGRAFGNVPLAEVQASINNTYGVRGINECFSQKGVGELMVVLDSWNLIEVSVNQGRAVERFPIDRPVVVELTRTQGG